MTEREHCERAAHELLNGHVSARDWCTCGDAKCDKYGAFKQAADLIARERAAARAEALEEAATMCDVAAACERRTVEHLAKYYPYGDGRATQARKDAEAIRALKETR